MTGIGSSAMRVKIVALIAWRASTAVRSRSSAMSAPDAKTPSEPVSTRMRGSRSRASQTSCSSSTIRWSIALRRSGRSSVTTTRSAASATRSVSIASLPRIANYRTNVQ